MQNPAPNTGDVVEIYTPPALQVIRDEHPGAIDNEFELQGINFLGTQEAAPCYWMNGAIAEGAEEAMKGRGGLRAKILTNGRLKKSPEG